MAFDFTGAFTGIMANVQAAALNTGPIGIFTGMVLESSIVPIPSEAILISASFLGYTPLEIAIWGGLGSTVGGVIGYHIGKWGGRPVLDKYGKYIFITPEKLDAIENWFKRWGNFAVLVGRLIPIIPFKIFSITAGIARMNLRDFTLFTLIGSIPRAFLLAWIGYKLVQIGSWPVTIAALLGLILLTILVDEVFIKAIKKKK